ncbi:MAG TPA: hypothetical protein VE781_12470 [Kineosporiaceae bacterium]|nr:hypothetical protein [Kineosporiaceae bacterium]
MRITRGAALVALAGTLLAGCGGGDPATSAAAPVGSQASTTSATTGPPAATAPSPTPAVVTKTVTVKPTPKPAATPTPKGTAVSSKPQCPISTATLSALVGAPLTRIGIGPEQPLEDVPGVSAAGCSFSEEGTGGIGIVFMLGFGANGEKLWSYVPTHCKAIGGSTLALGIAIKTCTISGFIREGVVHRTGSVVWMQVDPGASASSKALSAKMQTILEKLATD